METERINLEYILYVKPIGITNFCIWQGREKNFGLTNFVGGTNNQKGENKRR